MDLNLLFAFDALLTECHVGRAAERLFIGQPAMSHALARLRTLLDDELLVRTGKGMEPTDLAKKTDPIPFAEPVRSIVQACQGATRQAPTP